MEHVRYLRQFFGEASSGYSASNFAGAADDMQKRWIRLILLLVVVCIPGCCWSHCPPGNSAAEWHTGHGGSGE